MKASKLHASHVGRRVIIKLADLDRYLAERSRHQSRWLRCSANVKPTMVPLFKVSHSNAMLNVLRKNDGDEFAVRGFRSSFEDWAAETTDFPRDLVKLCTAHAAPNGQHQPDQQS